MKLDIKKLKEKHPKLCIYYFDNQEWVIYKEPPPPDANDEMLDELELMCGADYDMSQGYAPDLVCALGKALGIEVESI